MRILFILFFLGSCSHMQGYRDSHGHHGHKHDKKHPVDWKQEHEKLNKQHAHAKELFQWALDEMAEHEVAIKEHEATVTEHNEKFDKLKNKNNMQAKKMKLKIARLQTEMQEKHNHIKEDHEKIMTLVKKLEKIKKELQSHEGHNH